MRQPELQYINGYTAYIFKHIHYDFIMEISEIQQLEWNLEMVIDREYGTIYAYRYDYPPPVAEFVE